MPGRQVRRASLRSSPTRASAHVVPAPSGAPRGGVSLKGSGGDKQPAPRFVYARTPVMRIALACFLMVSSVAAHAQSPLTRSEQAVINFGFATQLGSGVYTMSGRTLQVYKIPFGYDFGHEPDA